MYRILVVEDDPGIAQAVCAHLRQWELEARCVQNFRAVMDEFTAFDPQLVLLDISLPFFNGYHWCTQIRSVSRVPVMFLSSAAENMNIVMAMNMGADDFIAKPFDLDVLTAKVQALLRRTYDFAAASPVLSHRGAVLQTGDQSLLIACDPADADALFAALKDAVPSAQRVGTVQPYAGGARIYLK